MEGLLSTGPTPSSLFLSPKVFVCQSASLSNTLIDNSRPDFYLFIRDIHQDLSVSFSLSGTSEPTEPILWTNG